jgi:hypothetical protein
VTAARRRPRAGLPLPVLLLVAAACAGAPPMPDPPATHPASKDAPEAPETAPTSTLTMPARTPKAPGSERPAGVPGRGH